MPEATFGVIGGGMMGEALIARLLDQEIFAPGVVLVSDPQAARREVLHQTYGVQTTAENQSVMDTAETVLLAIKPQMLTTVAENLKQPTRETPPLLLSILAGTTLARLQAAFPTWAVVRAMPNTPATVGAGVTALAAGESVSAEQRSQARTIFASVGTVVEVPEYQMDAVTALSGSGPGYLALVVEALADGGVAVGLPRAVALELAIATVRGTGELLHQGDLHPAVLKDRVTSPGGTTIAGISALEAGGMRSALMAAVRSAYLRSKELGQS
ncbi:pyrroline-5-carboxylate reductase [Nodosilinea sp. LEGE 07298]|uniref:pyrroline-5-carboxylate reductase n=1 Tax=Nodosilinea sp. LEGE 07298 TaxID=2777970 RepID=UPI0018817381|nr:pyrroline-5-carboxylate reductase [Nodosilinea sp. LEGE 07298]MBE9112788.1 pyrroline-5-carboxylate reductase [Nodosilinea sp. LEGE 07298]